MRVILAHGIGLGSWLWERWLPLFPAEWTVEALQMPGHRPDSPDTTLAEMAAAIRAAVRAGPGPAAVVGHSASGLAAQLVAAELGPEELAALVLINPLPPGQVFLVPSRGAVRAALPLLPAFLTKRPVIIPERDYRRLGMNAMAEADIPAFYKKILPWPRGLLLDVLRRPRVDAERVRCPVLVCASVEDRIVPWQKTRVLADLYEGVCWRYDGLAHMPQVEVGGERMGRDIARWLAAPSRPEVLESEGFGPAEGIGYERRRERRGEAMRRRSAYGQKQSARPK